jgi:hypothetical protein
VIGLGSSGGTEAFSIAHVQIVALYDPKDGTIKHMHVVNTMIGAKPASEEEAIAEAKPRASQRHRNVEPGSRALK